MWRNSGIQLWADLTNKSFDGYENVLKATIRSKGAESSTNNKILMIGDQTATNFAYLLNFFSNWLQITNIC